MLACYHRASRTFPSGVHADLSSRLRYPRVRGILWGAGNRVGVLEVGVSAYFASKYEGYRAAMSAQYSFLAFKPSGDAAAS